jgi:hypothetical protein
MKNLIKDFNFGASSHILIMILIFFIGISFAVSISFEDFIHLAWNSIKAVSVVFGLSVILYFISKKLKS